MRFCTMFLTLLFIKTLHWVLQERVDYVSRLFIIFYHVAINSNVKWRTSSDVHTDPTDCERLTDDLSTSIFTHAHLTRGGFFICILLWSRLLRL